MSFGRSVPPRNRSLAVHSRAPEDCAPRFYNFYHRQQEYWHKRLPNEQDPVVAELGRSMTSQLIATNRVYINHCLRRAPADIADYARQRFLATAASSALLRIIADSELIPAKVPLSYEPTFMRYPNIAPEYHLKVAESEQLHDLLPETESRVQWYQGDDLWINQVKLVPSRQHSHAELAYGATADPPQFVALTAQLPSRVYTG